MAKSMVTVDNLGGFQFIPLSRPIPCKDVGLPLCLTELFSYKRSAQILVISVEVIVFLEF